MSLCIKPTANVPVSFAQLYETPLVGSEAADARRESRKGEKSFPHFFLPTQRGSERGRGRRERKNKSGAEERCFFFLFIFREDDEGGDEILSHDNARDIVEC